jgi:hypothetical protein
MIIKDDFLPNVFLPSSPCEPSVPPCHRGSLFRDRKFNEVLADKAFVFSEIAMIILINEFVIWTYENILYPGLICVLRTHFFTGPDRHLAGQFHFGRYQNE